MSSNIAKKNERGIVKLFETVNRLIQPEDKDEIVLPVGMETTELKSYVSKLIKEAQPRYIRIEGRPSMQLKDYKMPVDFFPVSSNTVPFMAGRGSIYFGPEGSSYFDETDEEREEREDEEQDVIIELENQQIDDVVIEGGITGVAEEIHDTIKDNKEEPKKAAAVYAKKQSRERVDVIITNENTNMKINVSNPSVNTQLTQRDYGEMIINHIFLNGRKTIDEIIKEIPAIEHHLMTLLINKLVTDGYLTLKDDVDIILDEETGEEKERKELRTLELVPIKTPKIEEKEKKNNND